MVLDPVVALETLISLGFHRVLTSGCDTSALEGLPLIKRLVDQVSPFLKRNVKNRVGTIMWEGLNLYGMDKVITIVKMTEVLEAGLYLSPTLNLNERRVVLTTCASLFKESLCRLCPLCMHYTPSELVTS